MQLCRMRILGLSIAAQLLAAELTRREAWENELDAPAADGEGRSEDREEQELSLSQAVLRFLNRNGLPVQVLPGDETGWRKLAGRIDAKIRALKIKIREEKRRYEALLERERPGELHAGRVQRSVGGSQQTCGISSDAGYFAGRVCRLFKGL